MQFVRNIPEFLIQSYSKIMTHNYTIGKFGLHSTRKSADIKLVIL